MSFQLQAKIIEQPVFSTSAILMSSDYYIFCENKSRQKVQNSKANFEAIFLERKQNLPNFWIFNHCAFDGTNVNTVVNFIAAGKTLFNTNCFLQRMKWSYLFSPWSIDASVDVPPVQRDQVDIVKDDAAQRPERFLQKKLYWSIFVFFFQSRNVVK